MNTETEFQLTLPNNASITFSPDNKPANYSTTLPSPISLEGEWEVALIDIQYPHNWLNIAKDVYIIFLIETSNKDKGFRTTLSAVLFNYKSKYEEECIELRKLLWGNKKVDDNDVLLLHARLPKGYYANVGDLITTLNEEIQDSINGVAAFASNREQTKEVNLIYRFNAIERSVQGFQTGMVALPEILCLDKQVKSLLEQANPTLVDKTQLRTRGKLLLNTIPSIYIYSDIIKYQFVGDVKVPLLGCYQFKA